MEPCSDSITRCLSFSYWQLCISPVTMAHEAFSTQRNPVRSREEVQLPLIEGSNSRGKRIWSTEGSSRWRRLLKQNEMSVRNVPSVIHACCILHKMLEIRRDVYEILARSMYCAWLLAQPTSRFVVAIPNNRAKRIRDALVQ